MSTDPPTGSDSGALRDRLQGALGDRYVLLEELGAGGTGTVFAARDLKHDRVVALKVLRPGVAHHEAGQRFLREIRIAARLTHPHIVPVFDSGEAAGLLYYVMPRTEGESLRTLLDREGRLPPERALAIAQEVAEALEHAHRAGIVHRDVKPGNVLLVDSHSLLADFGVARVLEVAADSITVTGAAVGTPAYMSPEQIAGEADLEPRSDVFSLGCVLYEMLMGERPFGGRTAAAIFGGHLRGAPGLERLREEASAGLAAVVERALATDPGHRYSSAGEMAEALRELRHGGPRRLPVTVMAAAAVVLVALGVWLPGAFRSPDLSDREGSVVVLPFGDAIQTPEEQRLVVDLAGELTRQLNRWDAVRAVPQVALAGVTFDLGFRSPVVPDLDAGLATARSLGVESLVALHVRIRGDSAEVTATRFDPRRDREVERPLESRGRADDPWRLAAGIAHGLLDLEGPVEEVEELRRQSANPEALRQYAEGLDLLERWRLAEAERAFRMAVELDSTFAMAHHYLALDLYWQGTDETAGLARRGPEAARLSQDALRHAGDLPTRDRLHVEGLNRFLEGDYEAARARSRELLARDSTDVYAWLLEGIVEFHDPWLVERAGALHPRSNLNRAARAFREAIRLNPGFHLGYGHLFDITGYVLRGVETGEVMGLQRPRDELIPPWEPVMDPSSLEPFGLAFLDSLVWLREESFRPFSKEDLRAGGMEMLETSLRTLRRWTAYAPDEPRPYTELVTWTIRQRALLAVPQSPELLDSLAHESLGYARRALDLRGDTLVSGLITMANLELAAGDGQAAREVVEDAVALAIRRETPLPRETSNVLLHWSDWERALELLDREAARSYFWPDPETGEMLGDAGVEPLMRRLAVLGSTDSPDPLLRSDLQELEERWSSPPPGTAPIAHLRETRASTVAPALARVPDVLEVWRREADLHDPLWTAIDPATPDRAAAVRAAANADDRQVSEAIRAYLLGTAAVETGQPELALRLLARLDSIPHRLDARDVGWGLRTLALYRRGEALEALGDTAASLSAFEQFLQTRLTDDAGSPLEAAARGRLVRQSGGG